MNADCAFWIGSTHRVCQDYALAVSEGGAAHVILADGCSSSPDTDVGARLLAHSARRLLPALPLVPDGDEQQEWAAYHDGAARQAADCARALGLEDACLDATLLTIKAAEGAFVAACCGDGVVALGRRDGRVEVYTVSFAGSYPGYPSYSLDTARRTRWEAQPDNAKSVHTWVLGRPVAETREEQAREERAREERAREEGVKGERASGPGEAYPSQGTCELFRGDTADYRFVAVLSDGVQSFTRPAPTETSRATLPLALTDVLADLLAFKGGGQGQVVQRRARAFAKACHARGWDHADDVSLGVVWLGD